MKKNLKSILQKLEKIEENQIGQLQGGFASFNTPFSSGQKIGGNKDCLIINNCRGSNCVEGCSG